jgi:glycogen debranching enzyme
MALFARDLAYIASQLGRTHDAAKFEADADALSAKINARLWDEATGFYYDWTRGGQRHDVRTIGGFWTLLAGVATPAQAERLVAHLQNTNQFCRRHRVPTVSADQHGFHPAGDYWRGAVWTPTDMMVVRGLERYGYDALAREIALNHLENIVEVFTQTGTIWENYAPDSAAPGKPAKGDFVGWSGIGPIVYLLEFAIGLKPDARANTLTWDLSAKGKVGCERYRFAGHVVDLLATPDGSRWRLRVRSDGEFTLRVVVGKSEQVFSVKQGDNTLTG